MVLMRSSMSTARRGLNGRGMPTSEMTGLPCTVTSNVPLRGRTWFTATLLLLLLFLLLLLLFVPPCWKWLLTAFSTFAARLLNTPQLRHASTYTAAACLASASASRSIFARGGILSLFSSLFLSLSLLLSLLSCGSKKTKRRCDNCELHGKLSTIPSNT